MRWIISIDNDITPIKEHLDARREFIHELTGGEITEWKIKGNLCYCDSKDNINGVYVVAHNLDVKLLLKEGTLISESSFIIINSCSGCEEETRYYLKCVRNYKNSIKLYLAKQEVCYAKKFPYIINVIEDVGRLGFLSSYSDRMLWKNRHKGFYRAVQIAYDEI